MITVTGNNLRDVKSQIDYRDEYYPIVIKWRPRKDFERAEPLPGCIIKCQWLNVPMEFDSMEEAIIFLSAQMRQYEKQMTKENNNAMENV